MGFGLLAGLVALGARSPQPADSPSQSTISKSNASAAVSRAGSLERNSRNRSALMLESDNRRGLAGAGAPEAGPAVTRSRTDSPKLRLKTSSTLLACSWRRSENRALGSAMATVNQGSSSALGWVAASASLRNRLSARRAAMTAGQAARMASREGGEAGKWVGG